MKQGKKQGWFSCLLHYASGSRELLAGSAGLSVISVISGLIPYYCMYRILEQFIRETASLQSIIWWCGLAAGAYLIKILFFGLSTGLSHYVAYHILEKLRLQVADRFLHAPLGAVMSHSIGEIKNIMVDKIDEIEPPLAHMIPEGCGHIALPVCSFLALAVIDWRIALSALVTLPLSVICMALTFWISGKNFEKYDKANGIMNSIIVEYVEGIEVIKAFGRGGMSYEKFANAIEAYKVFVVKWLTSTWVPFKLAFALFPSTLLGTLPMSLFLASRGSIPVAQAALCVMLSMSMVTSLGKLEVFGNTIKQVQLTVEELQTYLEMPALAEPGRPVQLKDFSVEIKQVHFAYDTDGKEVLHGVDLSLPQGSFTALVGPSGSGKSTLARLISRYWDVSSGEISIGGVQVQDMPLAQLTDTVSFVAQDNFLFRCSLKENIRLGNPDASDEEVYAAARAARCEEFIHRLPLGYDTPAGEAGKRLSGGEKQRIAIARMILKNAPVILLDEATAFTDPENEAEIQRSIEALTREKGGSEKKTLLVIAHRLSTIRKADKIVLLEQGRITDSGTQEELLLHCPLYRKMWEAHIGAKAWAAAAREKEERQNVSNN